jgi:hypothetical protein
MLRQSGSKTSKLKSVLNVSLEDIGFTLNEEKKAKRINCNRFSEFIRRHYLKVIFVALEQRYYVYKSGVWKEILSDVLKFKVRKILHFWVQYFWSAKLKLEYMTVLQRDCTREDSMDSNRITLI